ncbi:hypothetical protein [Escherichia coli]|uniref:hypothetical protein n=1 Tax=Escherichia coli TaxID=562 RepID=UPI001CBD5825|nr:hypothetical protein [Escherichia coli]MCD9133980.1 hypothetical protein [Escherichia coli]
MIVDIILQHNCTKLLFKGADFTTAEDVKQIVSTIAAGRYNFSPEILQSTELKKFVYDVVPWKSYWVLIGTDQNNSPFVTWGSELTRG